MTAAQVKRYKQTSLRKLRITNIYIVPPRELGNIKQSSTQRGTAGKINLSKLQIIFVVSVLSFDQVTKYIGLKLLFLQLSSRKYIDDLHENIIPSLSPGNQSYRCKLLHYYCHANTTHHLLQNGRRLPHRIQRAPTLRGEAPTLRGEAPIYISRNNFRTDAGLGHSPINRRDKEKFGGSIFSDLQTMIRLPV